MTRVSIRPKPRFIAVVTEPPPVKPKQPVKPQPKPVPPPPPKPTQKAHHRVL